MASNEHQTVSTGNARLNQFKGFIGNTKEAKRANERRIYKPPLFRFHPNTKTSPYSYIVFKLQLLCRYRTTTTSCFHQKNAFNCHTNIYCIPNCWYWISVGFKFTNRIGPGSNFFHYTQQQVDLKWTSIFIHAENWLVVNVWICQHCNLWKYILKYMISAELLQSGFISERISSRMWKRGDASGIRSKGV